MTSDFDLISRQLRREIEQGEIAQSRLKTKTRAAEDKSYASSTVYGQQMVKTAFSLIANQLAVNLKTLGRGQGAVDGATVFKHLKNADLEITGALTAKVLLDVLGKKDHHVPSQLQITVPIGSAIETEQKLCWYLSQDKDLFKRTEQSFHGSTGTRQKATVFRLKFNEAGLVWKPWGSTVQHKVGSWALRALIESTGWVYTDLIWTSPRKSKTVIRFTQEFLGLRDSIMERALSLSYCLYPMLCAPALWTNEQRGGYLTEEIRGTSPMIRKASFDGPPKQGNVPIDFLNNINAQKLRINHQVLEVAEWCYENRRQVDKFRISDALPLLDPFLGDPVTEPVRFKEWKREQRKINDFNAQLFQYNWRVTETLFVARMYKNEPSFRIPWSYCYRGRIYPLCTGLNPQGTDFDKSLFYFAEEGPVDEYWLAWSVATCFGHDKLSHDNRVKWTRQHKSLISRIADDPISNISEWEKADEPWCFLASVFEYAATCINFTKTTSGLGIGLDATLSGLQHLSSLTKDKVAGAQCNLISNGENRPNDGYKTVAEASLKYIKDPEIHPYITRSVTKRCVMTKVYGCSRDSARTYIRQALKKSGFDISIPGRLGEIVDAIYKHAMPEVFEGPVKVMDWLQESATTLLRERGQETIEWITPSGFRVVQDIRHPKTKRIKTQLMGQVQKFMVGDGYGGVDYKGHKAAIAPNFVHSLDSALIQLTFAYWDRPFSVIHDCVLVRSCDTAEMMSDIRMHHAEIYKGDPLYDFADQLGLERPEHLMKNTLNIDDVNDSPYFFC